MTALGLISVRADWCYRIKLGAKSGDSVILEVTPEMLAQQFAEVDKYAKPQVSTAPATSRKMTSRR